MNLIGLPITVRRNSADRFAVCQSNLAGANPTILFSDPRREISHARVSPDGQWLAFTRFAQTEDDGYGGSEIIVCAMDSSVAFSVVFPVLWRTAANAYWAPDGQSLLYVATDYFGQTGILRSIRLDTWAISEVLRSGTLSCADPHVVGKRLAFVGISPGEPNISRLLVSDDVGNIGPTLRVLSDPSRHTATSLVPPFGYFDPRLSPDGAKVAAMLHTEGDRWNVCVFDVASGTETNLSQSDAIEACPDWSSDGAKLIFWKVTPPDLANADLYTMAPDGSGRARVPLPAGSWHTMPAFFPGDGSGPTARIVYSRKSS